MEAINVEGLKDAYYEYLMKIPNGLEVIVDLLNQQEMEQAFHSIANLAEGIESLIMIEQALLEKGTTINSRITEAMGIYNDINASLIEKNYGLLKEIIEVKLSPLFSSAIEWTFKN